MNSRDLKNTAMLEVEITPGFWGIFKEADWLTASEMVRLKAKRIPESEFTPRPCRRLNNPGVIIAHIGHDGVATDPNGNVLFDPKTWRPA